MIQVLVDFYILRLMTTILYLKIPIFDQSHLMLFGYINFLKLLFIGLKINIFKIVVFVRKVYTLFSEFIKYCLTFQFEYSFIVKQDIC